MDINQCFWFGIVLCMFSIIMLTYITIRFRKNTSDNRNSRFTKLIGSDSILTLITGVLLIVSGTTNNKYNNSDSEETVASNCTTGRLLMRLSTFLIPVLTGSVSIPSWAFQSYKCTNCNSREENDTVDQNHRGTSTKPFFPDKTTTAMLIVQWVIPILSIIGMAMTRPESIEIYTKDLTSYNETLSSAVFTINMGQTSCSNSSTQNVAAEAETPRVHKQVHTDDETLTTKIVNEIYSIINSRRNSGQQIPLQQIDENPYSKLMNNLSTSKTSNDNGTDINIYDKTMTMLYSIADKIRNGETTKTIEESNQKTTTSINILKLMDNYTSRWEDYKHPGWLSQNNIRNFSLNLNTSECYMTCQLSQTVLKRVFFVILFSNLFFPLILTVVLRVLISENIKMLQVTKDDSVNFKCKVKKMSERDSTIGLVTLSPTILETTARTLLSLKVPQYISSALLIMALVGMVIRNLAGLQLIDAIHNASTAVHPLNQSSDDTVNETTQYNLPTKPQEVASTSAMQNNM